MTAKQRAKIYRKVAQDIFDRTDGVKISRGCVRLSYCLPQGIFTPKEVVENTFSEFHLFINKRTKRYCNGWWEDSKDGNYQRILALLLSEQIALTP